MAPVLRFIDLFAGLGGFHLALSGLGHTCVFASEIDSQLAGVYSSNFGLLPVGDIRKLEIGDVPSHDVLCAGFPCQPFSKAGNQNGLECPQSGDLIHYVVEVLKARQPEYLILENVPNLVRHDGGETLRYIEARLRRAGYSVAHGLFSPHDFGIPQVRPRAFIVGRRGGLKGFEWPSPRPDANMSVRSVLDVQPTDAHPLQPRMIAYLSAWQAFMDRIPSDQSVPSCPIWAEEFGATYPFEERTPRGLGLDNLSTYRGSLGRSLANASTEDEVLAALPPYARDSTESFPDWKIDFIRRNREFYSRNQPWIDAWSPTIAEFPPSFRKFEWNCRGETRRIWDNVIQFRPSGIRVKRPVTAPSLVALGASQVPIIGWERRFMTVRECSRLQGMQALTHWPIPESAAFKALGNAVNVDVVKLVAEALLPSDSRR